jgi:hypothetical protein
MPDTWHGAALSWAWTPSYADTFRMKPVAALLRRWLADRTVIVDPFARHARIGTITNDLDPRCGADYQLDARDFLRLLATQHVSADALLFDPPYSPRQIAEFYRQLGRRVTTRDTQNARLYRECRDLALPLLRPDAVVISCGWSGIGFGVRRGCRREELLVLTHGAAHHATLVLVERYCPASDLQRVIA